MMTTFHTTGEDDSVELMHPHVPSAQKKTDKPEKKAQSDHKDDDVEDELAEEDDDDDIPHPHLAAPGHDDEDDHAQMLSVSVFAGASKPSDSKRDLRRPQERKDEDAEDDQEEAPSKPQRS